MGETVPVANKFCPRLHAAQDPLPNPVNLGKVPGCDPKTFDRQLHDSLAVPTALVLREDLLELIEDTEQGVKGLLVDHNS
jgi:hypothetical protein